MAEITAALVKELRDISSAGMMDCKKALQETEGNIEAAIDWLKTKGLSKAAKKADRVAAEGVVAVAVSADGKTGAVIELNAETDFVARNDQFQAAARKIAQTALTVDGDVEALRKAKTADGEVVDDMITSLIATIGENMLLRRATRLTVSDGAIGAYVHGAVAGATDLGRIGVLVAVESTGDQAQLKEMGRNIGMHAAAMSPLSLSPDDLDPAAVDRERAIFSEQAAASGKPANVIEKMIEGRIRKFFEEVVLLKQTFVKNPDQKVEDYVAEVAKSAGAPAKVTAFVRLALGEGVEKQTSDFAAEVASMTGGA
ncbi:translation elongation factor Ts [Caulobacter sp. KR2-114]|uniref:translation elongation factor Ts n=1 Tax=Caulobacter sp. KR2-114 TaxID=3400912 RepID=UPI003C08406F